MTAYGFGHFPTLATGGLDHSVEARHPTRAG